VVLARSDASAAPDFTVPTLEGGEFTLSTHLGKPVMLFFMAYWCGTCVPEAKALSKLHQHYGDRVIILAIDVDPTSTPEGLQNFRSFAGDPGYIWAFDKGNRVARAYRVRTLDSTFLINQIGEIVYSDARPTPYQTLEAQIKEVL
jgi:thiol-disulfide isomerase/thioredoxin